MTEVSAANYIGVFGTVQMLTVCGGTGRLRGGRGPRLAARIPFRRSDGRSESEFSLLVNATPSIFRPTWLGVFAGASHSPGRIVAVASSPPNSDQASQFQLQQLSPHWEQTFVAADGSVKLVAETIDQATYLALCTRELRAGTSCCKSPDDVSDRRDPESPIAAVNPHELVEVDHGTCAHRNHSFSVPEGNGTPLLDIKPYVSEYDGYANQRGGWLDDRGARRDVHLGDERFLDSADGTIFCGPDF